MVALYTKEPRPNGRNTPPTEPDNRSEDLKLRPHPNQAEQLSLLSREELAKLQCPMDIHILQEGEVQSPKTTETDRSGSTAGGPVQLKLPGF